MIHWARPAVNYHTIIVRESVCFGRSSSKSAEKRDQGREKGDHRPDGAPKPQETRPEYALNIHDPFGAIHSQFHAVLIKLFVFSHKQKFFNILLV